MPAGTQAGAQIARAVPGRSAGRISAICVSIPLRDPRFADDPAACNRDWEVDNRAGIPKSAPSTQRASADRGCRSPETPPAHPHLHRARPGRPRERSAGPSPRLLPRCLHALVLALGGAVTGMILLGDSWLQLLMAGALGVIFTQFAFLGHEASHRQIFDRARPTTGPDGCWPPCSSASATPGG